MNIYVYKMSFLITHFLPSHHTAFYPLSKEFPKSEKHTVEPLYNGHLGDRRKWPLWRGGRCREVETRVNVWTVCPKKLPLWRGGPLVDWFHCNWITIKLAPFPSTFENGSLFSFPKITEPKRHCSAANNFLLIQSFNFTRLATYFVPCEQWFLLAGCYATKGEKPLPATVCFSIKQACPRDAYIKTSNDITSSCFARNVSKTTTLQMNHTFLYTSLLFLHDYHIKMPYFVVYGDYK